MGPEEITCGKSSRLLFFIYLSFTYRAGSAHVKCDKIKLPKRDRQRVTSLFTVTPHIGRSAHTQLRPSQTQM